MKQFQILRYLKKYQAAIAIGSILAGVLFYCVVSFRLQTYTAATVFEYTNADAVNGYAPDGTGIDTEEITASNIMAEVLRNLKLSDKVNVDVLRKNISIEPVITDEERMTLEAKIELGEQYEINSTRYLISFSSEVKYGKEYPRRVLNEIMDVYMAYYGENHVNSAGGSNVVNDIYSKGYDYIEMMEVIDDSLTSTLDLLGAKIDMNDTWRSFATGYSFTDLYREFSLIQEVQVSKISADILQQKITKSRDVLLAKYRNRNNTMAIANQGSSAEIDKIIKVIDTYVEMMSSSDNTDINSEYILDELYENYGYDEAGAVKSGRDQTTEYDRLLNGYVNNRTAYEENLIDTAYNEYVIAVYQDAEEASPGPLLQDTEERIRELAGKYNGLYQILDVTNDEFNEYLGADNIAVRSSVGVAEKIPVNLFTAFIVIVFGVIGCAGAIFLGRVQDFVDYYAFTNKVVGLPNRASCDRYIASLEGRVIPGRFACAAFKLTNLREENARLGRQTGDRMMKTFAEMLTSIFTPSDRVFAGYNGAGQYLVFAEDQNADQMDAAIKQLRSVVEQHCQGMIYSMEIQDGLACAEEESCYQIRALLSIAMYRMGMEKRQETNGNHTDRQHSSGEQTQGVRATEEDTAATQHDEKPEPGKPETGYPAGKEYYAKFRLMKEADSRKSGRKSG